MTKLSVNLNKIALLRNQRNIGIPSVIEAAKTVIKAGANGVTVHPRPDERHIKYSDVYELAEMLNAEFNIEGNPFTGKYMDIVCEVKPAPGDISAGYAGGTNVRPRMGYKGQQKTLNAGNKTIERFKHSCQSVYGPGRNGDTNG